MAFKVQVLSVITIYPAIFWILSCTKSSLKLSFFLSVNQSACTISVLLVFKNRLIEEFGKYFAFFLLLNVWKITTESMPREGDIFR
jgi:hypothetical protein